MKTSALFWGGGVKNWPNLPTGGGRGQKLAKFTDVLNEWFLTALNYEIFVTNPWEKTGSYIRARVVSRSTPMKSRLGLNEK